MDNFHSFGLPQPLLKSLTDMGFNEPTPIQLASIPDALQGRDILGSAQTGTGKTGAFGIPLLAKLMNSDEGTALVVTPTRELATQVMKALQDMMGHKSKIKTALIIGGESMGKQMAQLRAKPRLFVGTPGRINDHLRRGSMKLNKNEFLVLDETDRMLDMGFSVQIEEILEYMPQKRQTMLFSATLPKNIMNIAKKYMDDPKRVSVGSTHEPVKNIKQDVMHVSESDKYTQLLAQLEERTGSVIIFVKTKYGADRMAKKLREASHKADAIHGDLKHSKRERVIKDFRDSKYRVLVATDVAARGLDIPHIEHVINYDLPQCPEDYIHRIGRTARAGAEGEALCFVTPADRGKWGAIVRLINPDAVTGNASNDDRPARRPAKKDKSKWSKSRKDERRSDSRRQDSRRSDERKSDTRRSDERGSDSRRGDSSSSKKNNSNRSFEKRQRSRNFKQAA